MNEPGLLCSARTNAMLLIEQNTSIAAPPLCPEIVLRLMRGGAPMLGAAGKSLFHDDGPRPYWAFCWGSGQGMARYLLDHPIVVRGRRVVDFGAGSGVAGIAAAKAGAAHVTALDADPLARAAIEVNASLNGVAIQVGGDDSPLLALEWDVLLACDVCYRSDNWPRLCESSAPGKSILIADPGRPGVPWDELRLLARYTVRTAPELEDPDLTHAAVYRLVGEAPSRE